LNVEFDLPVDLTESEVLHLSFFLQSLPDASKMPDSLREVFGVEASDVDVDVPEARLTEDLDPLLTIPIEAASSAPNE